MSTTFFQAPTIQSQTKARIVAKYFKAWAEILSRRAARRNETFGYIDLFAGPGKYADGTASTPLLVLQQVIESPTLRDRFVSRFNDSDTDCHRLLLASVAGLSGIGQVVHPPHITCEAVDDGVAEWYESQTHVALLTFLDPFRYAPLSARLIQAAVKDPGSECVFFCNR